MKRNENLNGLDNNRKVSIKDLMLLDYWSAYSL
jgi:hypothetical protein